MSTKLLEAARTLLDTAECGLCMGTDNVCSLHNGKREGCSGCSPCRCRDALARDALRAAIAEAEAAEKAQGPDEEWIAAVLGEGRTSHLTGGESWARSRARLIAARFRAREAERAQEAQVAALQGSASIAPSCGSWRWTVTDEQFEHVVRCACAYGTARELAALAAHARELREALRAVPHGQGDHAAGCGAGIREQAGHPVPGSRECTCHLAARARCLG